MIWNTNLGLSTPTTAHQRARRTSNFLARIPQRGRLFRTYFRNSRSRMSCTGTNRATSRKLHAPRHDQDLQGSTEAARSRHPEAAPQPVDDRGAPSAGGNLRTKGVT